MSSYPIQEKIFKSIHTQNLIYNTCWEDPECDRQLLKLQKDSEIVMISSAGCNALDYLLDSPSKVNCIDLNPRQNALLELKMAVIQATTYEDLFQIFGKGKHPAFRLLYKEKLRTLLSDDARLYWDKHLHYFSGKGLRKSFYYYGTAGMLAWIFLHFINVRPSLKKKVSNLFKAESIEDQKAIYDDIEDKVFSKFWDWAMDKKLTMFMLGVPKSQQKLVKKEYPKGMLYFIKDRLRYVFTELSLKNNYFWYLYVHGFYTSDCCPNYLKKANQTLLQQNLQKISLYNNTISGFLKENPNTYSHYVLLDHQDWLAANNKQALEEEWSLILQNSKKGTKILFRSAASSVDFLPAFVYEKVWFEQELTAEIAKLDRVGTYASLYLAVVK